MSASQSPSSGISIPPRDIQTNISNNDCRLMRVSLRRYTKTLHTSDTIHRQTAHASLSEESSAWCGTQRRPTLSWTRRKMFSPSKSGDLLDRKHSCISSSRRSFWVIRTRGLPAKSQARNVRKQAKSPIEDGKQADPTKKEGLKLGTSFLPAHRLHKITSQGSSLTRGIKNILRPVIYEE